jgi:hypothetical protein
VAFDRSAFPVLARGSSEAVVVGEELSAVLASGGEHDGRRPRNKGRRSNAHRTIGLVLSRIDVVGQGVG